MNPPPHQQTATKGSTAAESMKIGFFAAVPDIDGCKNEKPLGIIEMMIIFSISCPSILHSLLVAPFPPQSQGCDRNGMEKNEETAKRPRK